MSLFVFFGSKSKNSCFIFFSICTANFATNLSPVLFFAWHGDVLWKYSIPMGLCNLTGAFVGSHLAIRKGNRFIRGLFLLILIGLIGRLVWDYLK